MACSTYTLLMVLCGSKMAANQVGESKMEKGINSYNWLIFLMEAASGFEPLNRGFADLCLTTWLRRLSNRLFYRWLILMSRKERG